MVLSKKIGIDLGTSTVLIYVKGEGIVVNEPSRAIVNGAGTRMIDVEREVMLQHLIRRVLGRQRIFKPDIMISVPTALTSVERRSVTQAAMLAGARQAWLIDEPIAAAIGAGLSIAEPKANAICDIGGGTTEIAVISMSGIVVGRSLRVGGNSIDDAIAEYLKRKHNLSIDWRAAEEVKIAIGSAVSMKQPLVTDVRGRDLVSGLPKNLEVSSDEVAEAIEVPLRLIARAVSDVLGETPPELAAEITERGIVLTGGGAQLRGLDQYLAVHTGIPAIVADEPQTSVVRGTGLALEHFEVLKRNQSYLR